MKTLGCFVLIILNISCGPVSTTTATSTFPTVPIVTTTPTPFATKPPPVTVTIPVGAIGMGPAAYGVNPLVVKAGTVVTWVNNDTVKHTATEIDTNYFDSNFIQPGGSYSFTFIQIGTYNYEDVFYGQDSMNGTIQVIANQ